MVFQTGLQGTSRVTTKEGPVDSWALGVSHASWSSSSRGFIYSVSYISFGGKLCCIKSLQSPEALSKEQVLKKLIIFFPSAKYMDSFHKHLQHARCCAGYRPANLNKEKSAPLRSTLSVCICPLSLFVKALQNRVVDWGSLFPSVNLLKTESRDEQISTQMLENHFLK